MMLRVAFLTFVASKLNTPPVAFTHEAGDLAVGYVHSCTRSGMYNDDTRSYSVKPHEAKAPTLSTLSRICTAEPN